MRQIGWRHSRVSLFILTATATYLLFTNLGDLDKHRDLYSHGTVKIHPDTLSEKSKATLNEEKKGVLVDSWDPAKYVIGPASVNFRDNLRNDTHYITSWTDGGFTNEFMTYVNMIYLGTLSNRVPIVPPFAPFHHITSEAGILPFGEVFNLTALRHAIHHPVLEWSDVKSSPSPPPSAPETLGCWSAWATGNLGSNYPRYSDRLTSHLSLDVSYTAVPRQARRLIDKEGEWDWALLFWPLASLIYPTHAPTPLSLNARTSEAQFSSKLGGKSPPDEHLACFDLLYFVGAGRENDEWQYPWCPAWMFVGRHLRFNDALVDMSMDYVRRALGVQDGGQLPPFIAIHVRRGDFKDGCRASSTVGECFASIPIYARRVKEVQAELLKTHGINIPDYHVLLTSDEKDPSFWSEVFLMGWKTIDHKAENTLELYGEWYLPIIDIVAQSLALGFVGTGQSTVSIMSQKRVEDWNHGVTRIVKWGGLGADDH